MLVKYGSNSLKKQPMGGLPKRYFAGIVENSAEKEGAILLEIGGGTCFKLSAVSGQGTLVNFFKKWLNKGKSEAH